MQMNPIWLRDLPTLPGVHGIKETKKGFSPPQCLLADCIKTCERLREFKFAQEPQPEPIHSEVTRWTPPQNSQLKVNYDGAVFNDLQQAGVGVVVRDAAGGVHGALSNRFILPLNVEDVEALACRSAVVFALELGLREVVFEGSSETITNALNSASP